MDSINLEQIKAQEVIEILGNIIQKSIIKTKSKGENETE